MALLWLAVIVFHARARWVGGGWMVFGLIALRDLPQVRGGTSLTKRVSVPEEALRKEVREAEYGNILVPIFGTKLDDDIVSTAGRLADAADEPGEERPRLEVIYVMELPLTVPLDAPPPRERVEAAEAALQRAKEVGEEYESVEVETELVPARSVGRRDRRGGAAAERGGDRDGRRAAESGRGRCRARGPRRLAAARGRGRHGVRAEEGAVPGAGDGASGG